LRADTILVGQGRVADTVHFALRDLSMVEYSAGEKHPRVKATLIGLGLGIVAGSVYGYGRTAGAGYACVSGVCSDVTQASKWHSAGQEAIIGAGVGLAAGFVSGSLITAQRWVTVRIDGLFSHGE